MRYMRPWNLTENFTKLPNQLLRLKGLSMTAKVIWGVLSRLSGGKTYCFPKIDTLAEELDLERKTVMSAINDLVTSGLLQRVRRGMGKSNVYHFLDHVVFSDLYTGAPDEVTTEPDEPDEEELMGSSIRTSRSPKNVLQEVQKPDLQKSEERTADKKDFIRAGLEDKSSSTHPQQKQERKPPKREGADLKPIMEAVNAYVPAGPDFAKRLRSDVLAANPNLSTEQIVAVIHSSVPKNFKPDSPGFFRASSPDVARSPRFQVVQHKPIPEAPSCGLCLDRGVIGAAGANCWNDLRPQVASGSAKICDCGAGDLWRGLRDSDH